MTRRSYLSQEKIVLKVAILVELRSLRKKDPLSYPSPHPTHWKWKCELETEHGCFNLQVLSMIHQRSTSISWDGCSGWAPVRYPASHSHSSSRFSFVWIFLFNIFLGPQRLFQILWSFRFTSLLLKINICIIMTWIVVLRSLNVPYRHTKKCKSLFLKLPVQPVVSQRFPQSFYWHHKRRIK